MISEFVESAGGLLKIGRSEERKGREEQAL